LLTSLSHPLFLRDPLRVGGDCGGLVVGGKGEAKGPVMRNVLVARIKLYNPVRIMMRGLLTVIPGSHCGQHPAISKPTSQ